ncbi:MAG UNVERIFIED_CONTAM: hypothetical protein LVR18_18900 [Planctomycetaceae bacterium]|jgi:epoxyqueuosine reductase QueG
MVVEPETPIADGPHELSAAVRNAVLEGGLDLAGIAPAVTPTGFHKLLDWLDTGHHGEMQWMESRRRGSQASAVHAPADKKRGNGRVELL